MTAELTVPRLQVLFLRKVCVWYSHVVKSLVSPSTKWAWSHVLANGFNISVVVWAVSNLFPTNFFPFQCIRKLSWCQTFPVYIQCAKDMSVPCDGPNECSKLRPRTYGMDINRCEFFRSLGGVTCL